MPGGLDYYLAMIILSKFTYLPGWSLLLLFLFFFFKKSINITILKLMMMMMGVGVLGVQISQ
jgi:hypothetical protein